MVFIFYQAQLSILSSFWEANNLSIVHCKNSSMFYCENGGQEPTGKPIACH